MAFFSVTLFLCGLLAQGASVPPKSDGTCGYECHEDGQCGGCGTDGKCSCPDGLDADFHEISCTCVSAPASPPAEPAVKVEDSVWPKQWTANVDAWCYGDFSNKTSVAHGKFYYDEALGRTRADWSPYISGHDAKQVWISSMGANASSTYYVATGPLCIKFAITDPGQGRAPVGVERSDWMQKCKEAGFAHYVGREQVQVDSENVWADHWSCRLDYKAVNQSITFQNWHSLGLGSVPKGLPVRVTGGNSAPNPTRGSPRLNTVWYKDFVTGPSATKPEDFEKPNFGLCIPVDGDAVQEFFGHAVELAHVFSPEFQRRAHHLQHRTPSSPDLERARRPRPGAGLSGSTFTNAMQKLNAVLIGEAGLATDLCSNMSLNLLHETQRAIFDARAPAFDAVYQKAGDSRKIAQQSLEELMQVQSDRVRLVERRPELAAKAKDGLCHEVVMWFVHHLTESARADVRSRIVLPLLPEAQHSPDASTKADDVQLHQQYTSQVSCAICHVAPQQGGSSYDASPIVNI
mmetsp:Transcript_27780/g.50743  ORF Transcript_27780/g.50743 Transcript_27780/m.50743 type:complete len:518 (-) Transcript_27780:83-1636(-)